MNRIEINLKKDASEILLFLNSKNAIDVGKNGQFKNYDLFEKLRRSNCKFPVYFVGEWDEEEQLWHGKRMPYNPNRNSINKKKN